MLGTIKEFKYKKIKNFLTEEERNLLHDYTRIIHRLNKEAFDNSRITSNAETYTYGDPLMESLMINKLPLMQKETGLTLLPTYAFYRVYTMFSDLIEHTDRDACEISVTVSLGSDGTPWPIYMNGNPIELEPGDACIYLGIEIPHKREEFLGDYQSQVFLHYVDKNGKNAKCFKDKRKLWGEKYNEIQSI